MSYRKLAIKAALAMVAGLGIATSSWGGTTGSTVSVSASVSQTCTITSTGVVAFGAFDPVANTAVNGTGTISLKCTKGSTNAVQALLDDGANASSGQRRLAGNSDFLNYEIYQPSTGLANATCAYTQRWGTTGAQIFTPAPTAWDALNAITFNVCGQIPNGQNPTAGTGYADTVSLTVNF